MSQFWSGYGAQPLQFEVKQDIEYKYRSHVTTKGDIQIDRARVEPWHNQPGKVGAFGAAHWEYWMTAQTQEHADELVAKAKQKPHYKYY